MSELAPASTFPPVSYATWRARVEAEVGARAATLFARDSLEGLTVEPLYAGDHLAADAPLPRLAPPAGPWRIWQEVRTSASAVGCAALGRESARDLGGVWLRVDDPAIDAASLAALLSAARVDGADVELAIEGAGEPLASAALLVAAAQRAGIATERLRGCLGCDPLGTLARTGALSAAACEGVAGVARWANDHAPALRAVLVSTAPYADAGADAVQEIAFALASGADALRRLLAAGLAPAAAAGQILVSTTCGRDLYLQVAKLRALRLGWAMLLAAHGAAVSSPRLHARTAWRTKGRRDPGTDLVRATVETLAAVLGGCSDVTCAPFLDADTELALGLPLGGATQLLLREEVGLASVADAAAGSWYVESLTALLLRRAWELFGAIAERGGMARELVVGGVARAVAESAERRRRALADGQLRIVGVTVHPAKRPVPLPHRPLATTASLSVPAAPSDDRGGAAGAAKSTELTGDATSPGFFAAAVAMASGGSSLATLAAAVPETQPALRAPALVAWRDAEAFEPAEEIA